MTDHVWIKSIVERVVGQVLESHAGQLREEIVRRVMEEVSAQPVGEAAPSAASAASDLARAVAEIQMGSTQREILRALLDSCARWAARVALFVVKGSHATGWQGRGFSNSDAVKDFVLDANAPVVMKVISDRVAVTGSGAELDANFLEKIGPPASGEGQFLPLVLKDKVAALVYADSGTDGTGQLDSASVELLVLSTSAWLEVNSLRKQVHKELAAEPQESQPAASAAAPSSFHDPFAAHAPGHAMAAVASAAPAGAESAASHGQAATGAPPLAAPEPALAGAGEVSAPSAEEEIHRKAQRFARLLVDEIKLYNQAKVTEGRKNKDLYDRLKEAIEKSRSTYQKRYGNTVAASGNYFQHELIRSLAEDDASLMGANFRH